MMSRGRTCLQVVTHELIRGHPIYRASQTIEYPGVKILRTDGDPMYLQRVTEGQIEYVLGKLKHKPVYEEINPKGWGYYTYTYSPC